MVPDTLQIGAAIVGVVFFALPGWIVVRRLQLPGPWAVGFSISSALWLGAVSGLDALGIPLNSASVSVTWTVLSAVLLLTPRVKPGCTPTDIDRPSTKLEVKNLPLLVALAVGAAAILVRCWIEPLNGWDNSFRWDRIGRIALETQNLGFFPPTNQEDFSVYSWPDGMPPLAPLLNLWLYLFSGSTAPTITWIRVASEVVLAAQTLAWAVGASVTTTHLRWWAPGLAAGSSLVVWGFAQTQEVGLATIGYVGSAAILARSATLTPMAAASAGACAGLAYLARDYHLILGPILAFGLVISKKHRAAAALAAFWFACCLPWLLRNTILTGNPVFPHSPGGLLATNTTLARLNEAISAWHAWRGIQPDLLLVTFMAVAGLPFLAALISLRTARRDDWPLWVAIAANGALWWQSLPYTAGGLLYSLRVLVPATALLAVLGARTIPEGPLGRRILGCVALLFALDASWRSWELPTNPRQPPWRPSLEHWSMIQGMRENRVERDFWAETVAGARGGRVLVDQTSAVELIQQHNGRPIAIFTPELAGLFGDKTTLIEGFAVLRALGITRIAITGGDFIADRQYQTPFFRGLRMSAQPVTKHGNIAVYDIPVIP
jgi:hypothetical protein